MKESERLLELARKEFELAAEAEAPAQMMLHADMGHQYLVRAEAAAVQEKQPDSGRGNGA